MPSIMRRSLDFGTISGNLSPASRSASANGTIGAGGTPSPSLHDAQFEHQLGTSKGSGRFGTVSGSPVASASATLSSGTRTQQHRSAAKRARAHFGLSSLFTPRRDARTSQQSPSPVQPSLDPSPGTATPALTGDDGQTPSHAPQWGAERALMQAVRASTAKDAAWEITVHQARPEGLFLEYGTSRRGQVAPANASKSTNKDRSTASSNGRTLRRGGRHGTAVSPLNLSRSIVASSGQAMAKTAGRLLGRHAADKHKTSTSVSDKVSSPATPVTSSSAAGSDTGAVDTSSIADTLDDLPGPMSPTKRRLESSGEEDSSTFGSPRSNSDYAESGSLDRAEQLLVLYVTTGTSSLTLYRKLEQLAKLERELRKSHANHMTSAAQKPSILTSGPPTPHSPASPAGHTRRRSVLASLTRTFGNPAASSRRNGPGTTSAAQTPLEENASTSLIQAPVNGSNEGLAQPQPFVQSQLSNLSDYLTSLSSIPAIRNARPWKSFFKLGKDDHESAHLERPIMDAFGNDANDRGTVRDRASRLKRIKSETGLGNYSRDSHPLGSRGQTKAAVDPARHAGRIDDSGIGVDNLGQSTGSTSLIKTHGHGASPFDGSVAMEREASSGTAATSAMSIFIEHTNETSLSLAGSVGDAEVLAYMERMRQESESRMQSAPFASSHIQERSANDGKGTPYVPPTPTSPADLPSRAGRDDFADSEELIAGELPAASPSTTTTSGKRSATPSAFVDSQDPEAATLPPLSGATVVASEEADSQHEQEAYVESAPSTPSAKVSPTADAHAVRPRPSRKASAASVRRSRKSSAQTSERTKKPSIKIDDFEILRVLGKGCAGKVLLARLKDASVASTSSERGSLYAIKAIHKHHVLIHRELAHTLTEQNILRKMATESSNPFIVKMRWSFQDTDNLFLVLDFHPGGDLATQLSRWGRLGKDRTRFYAAEIIDGLQSLHSAGVIYRDLKPENILLDMQGHIVLTDFGLSRQFNRPTNPEYDAQAGPSPHWLRESGKRFSSSPALGYDQIASGLETTMTFCGTAEYLAPEVLLGNPYSYSVDMWSLGTMIYEMLLGVTPFYNEDHSQMYRRVLHEELTFGSSDYLDGDTRALLRGLLQKEPDLRMTTARVKRAKYFEAIDWDFVSNKRYIPPFIPALSPDDPADTQNFEDCFLTMDLGFVDQKETEEIEAKARASGKEPDKAVDEHGRDVFEGYSFDGVWARDEDEAADDEEDGDTDEEEDEGSATEEDAASREQHSGGMAHDGLMPRGLSEGAQASEVKSIVDTMVPDNRDRAECQTTSDETESTPLQTDKAQTGEDTSSSRDAPGTNIEREQDMSSSINPRTSPVAHNPEPIAQDGSGQMRNSANIVLSPDSLPSTQDVIRKSVDSEDWDMVEPLSSDEVATNGARAPRKRLMAGTTLFAKGVVDRYKLQIKPLSRIPTPTRSFTARSGLSRMAHSSAQASASNLSQLSPTASLGGMSETPSSRESSDNTATALAKSPSKRLKAPRLLRASTDWVQGALPSSPTPKFRLQRNKKDPNAADSQPQTPQAERELVLGTSPAVSVDSQATIPVERATAAMHPLTRQRTRERDNAHVHYAQDDASQ